MFFDSFTIDKSDIKVPSVIPVPLDLLRLAIGSTIGKDFSFLRNLIVWKARDCFHTKVCANLSTKARKRQGVLFLSATLQNKVATQHQGFN